MRLSKDRKTGFEEGRIVEDDKPLMLAGLPKPAKQFTAQTQVRHPRRRKGAK